MARYNEILSARFNRALTKQFGMKAEAPAPQLAPDIQPVFPHFTGAENLWAEGWDRFAQTLDQAGVAAQNAAWQLRNPASSGVVVVLEKVTVALANAGFAMLRLGPIATDYSSILAGARIDARTQRIFSTAIVSGQNNAATTLTQLYQIACGAAFSQTEIIVHPEQEITVLPGDAIQIMTLAANVEIVVNALWRERSLELSEQGR